MVVEGVFDVWLFRNVSVFVFGLLLHRIFGGCEHCFGSNILCVCVDRIVHVFDDEWSCWILCLSLVCAQDVFVDEVRLEKKEKEK